MGIRPARACRDIKGQPWARISQSRPRKSFVKGAPRPKVRQYDMGADQYYELQVDLSSLRDIQLRDNAMEAARQSANKYMEKILPGGYYLKLRKYPHLVLREHAALGVAGADRISKGMKKAFGRPKGRLAQFFKGDIIFSAYVPKTAVPTVKEAYRRAACKLSGKWEVLIKDITTTAWNVEKKGRAVREFKKEEKVEAAATTEVAAAATAAPAAGAAPAAEAKKEEKPKK